MKDNQLIYDWNEVARRHNVIPANFELVDETLRDGIQSPSVRNPTIDEKVELLHLMDQNSIANVDLGLPGAGAEAVSDVTRLVQEIDNKGLKIKPNCAGRTHPNDINAIANITQKTGVPIEVCAFLGASPVRLSVENWDIDTMVEKVKTAGEICQKEGLPFSFVTEDTTRSSPATLDVLFRAAIDHGATRFIICDTTGHATPDGLYNLLVFTRNLLSGCGAEHVQLDWHGHNDRGLALPLALSALEFGFNRVHGTCLGVGERVGNTSIDHLILNLHLLGALKQDLRPLVDYVHKVSEFYEVPIHYNYPAFGRDAFRTATGVHAAAIAKANVKERNDLADKVYSSIPASLLDRRQIISVGFYSGKSNVVEWLKYHKIEPTKPRVDLILNVAKSSRRTLQDKEIFQTLDHAGLLDRSISASYL